MAQVPTLPPDGTAFTIGTVPQLYFDADRGEFTVDELAILYVLAYSAECLVVTETSPLLTFQDFQSLAQQQTVKRGGMAHTAFAHVLVRAAHSSLPAQPHR